ncbi:interleukin-9 receptor isoform X2 [Meriones unguiculatus]|uniref:interleukin-9 receptor isoform X2 n=1 Tax=Meriones unguiculatus TaxID=10047 RepID=UPI000B4F042C|nr:interleukin-9 receptor isoform X2 [Meriones unguiculatus]
MAPGRCAVEGWTLERKAVKKVLRSWLLVYTCVCSCICWAVSVPEQGGGEGAKLGTFTCFSNGVLRIDCRWSAPELGQESRAWLLFTSNQVMDSKHRCTFWDRTCTVVLPPEEVFLPTDNFTVTFHRCVMGQEQVSLVDSQYLLRRHVKLDPPSDLQSNVSAERCVLTWSISLALEPLSPFLSYELAFKRQEEAWEARHKDHIVGVTWLVLESVELNPGSTYEARLRVQMTFWGDYDDVAEGEYSKSHWSEWSEPVPFPSPRRWRQGLLVPSRRWSDSILVAVSIFLLLTGLVHLLFKLSPRVKRIFSQNVPSPEAFFHPLYSVYNGDFQTWAGAHRAGPQPRQDDVSTPSGGSESSIWEAITALTYSPACPVQFSGLKWEYMGSGFPEPPSSENVLPTGCLELEGQPSAYLPQEDWAPLGSPRPPPLDSDSGSSDYCVLDCCEECQLSAFPELTQSPELTQAQLMALPVSSRA